MTIMDNVLQHDFENWVMKVEVNRFIVGRPNPITVPVNPKNFEQSHTYVAGAHLTWKVKQIDLWTYVEDYPPQIDVDCRNLTLNHSVKIGDVEPLLPEGVFLHSKYDTHKYHAIASLKSTKWYKARKQAKQNQMAEFRKQKRALQMGETKFGVVKKKRTAASDLAKTPLSVASSKIMMKHAKNMKIE